MHTRHTPDVLMHRNALQQLGAPEEQITLLTAFTQAMADDTQRCRVHSEARGF